MKTNKFLAIVLIFVTAFGCVVLGGCERVPEQKITVTDSYTLYTDVPYGDGGIRQLVDLCIPTNPVCNGLIMDVHGGAWVAGDKDGCRNSVISRANDGYISAALNYRYISRKVDGFDILDDIQSALAVIKDILAQNGIDCTKVALIGGSAGGHLSLLYCYARADVSPIAPVLAVSLSGPTDLTDESYFADSRYSQFVHNYYDWFSWISNCKFDDKTRQNATSSLAKVSPISYVTENTVPTLLAHGTADEIVPYNNAVILDQKLTLLGVPHDFVTFVDAGHGLEKDDEAKQRFYTLLDEYYRQYLIGE